MIFGLGLGLIVQTLIDKSSVTRIEVIELDNDVIDLVGDYYMQLSTKVIVRQGNALTMEATGKYDAIWFDI